jgi:hypothetical protein
VPYGALTASQEAVLVKYVRGRVVTDLGSGDLSLTTRLLEMGAEHVHCIDKEAKPYRKTWPTNLSYKQTYFHDMRQTAPMDVAFMSWPVNHQTGLESVIERAQVVVYLGCNTGGSACGTPDLFKMMVQRELLDYVPDRRNSLLVVGKRLEAPRRPTGEELAGISSFSDYFSFKEAERNAADPRWKSNPLRGFAV